MLKIRVPEECEFDLLKDFPPEAWNFNLLEFLRIHFNKEYFYPAVAEFDGRLAGFGNSIINGRSGWVGNIIVPPEFRRKGIGHALTTHVVDYIKSKGCSTVILIASEMGKDLYKKIGFKETAIYHFFNGPLLSYKKDIHIERLEERDIPFIKQIDGKATGETRFEFIKRFFPSGWIYKDDSGKITGVYLPDMGLGLITADSPEAGLELLKFKLSTGTPKAIIPAANKTAMQFLENSGYMNFMSLPRMVIGNEVTWKPELIFNRATGYCG